MKNQDRKGPEENQQDQSNQQKKSNSGNAANIDAIISSPTDAARSHRHTDTWSNQGTNTSYEGATAPGGGGSVGTGQGSGQDAVGARISTSDASDYASGNSDKRKGEEDIKPDEHNDNLDRDTLGTP